MQEDKKAFWLGHIEGAKSFEGPQWQYCAQQGISSTALCATKRALGMRGKQGQGPKKFARVEHPTSRKTKRESE